MFIVQATGLILQILDYSAKNLAWANTLAYLSAASVTKKKTNFMTILPGDWSYPVGAGVCVLKLFSFVSRVLAK